MKLLLLLLLLLVLVMVMVRVEHPDGGGDELTEFTTVPQ